ncbi:uncharacterized protein B0H64DRAFT_413593 [Chaetomium fimeti]|uniref:Uncharacterized protein n=1 Tax=Chaetomium fimeti TaxID=1854472 RepID=A0AAE0H5G0_9PEZI|nr:hypothetical protein B0H64DRAFT_413593 [Chaetomium fimeti]
MAKQTLLGVCLVAALATMTAAQASSSALPVATVLLDRIEGAAFEASVVSVLPEGTLFSIDCRTTATVPEPTNECSRVVGGLSIMQGSIQYTADWTVTDGPAPTTTVASYVACVLQGDNGYCTNTVDVNGVVTTTPYIFTSIWDRLSPITITAGAEKLLGSAAPTVSASTVSNTTQQTPPASSAVVTGAGAVLRPAGRVLFGVLAAGLVAVALGGGVV